MYYQFIKYIQFLFGSTNAHGVHSPFVYKLITQCFYNPYKFADYDKIKAYRKALLESEDTIIVKDFGSGSKVFKNASRSVSKIVKHVGAPLVKAKLLYRLVHYFKPKQVLELGTSLGVGTIALALNQKETTVTTIEGCTNTLALAQQQLKSFNVDNVNFLNEEFSEGINSLLRQDSSLKFDLIYFDGNHQKEATLNYFKQLLPTVHNYSVWIFDDIYWNKDMCSAWEIIKQHPQVTVTIDVFHFGLVFFRTEQSKQDFKVRL